MIVMAFAKPYTILIKDGNKVGKRKRKELLFRFEDLHKGSNITISMPNFKRKQESEFIWNVYVPIDGTFLRLVEKNTIGQASTYIAENREASQKFIIHTGK